MFVLLVVCAEPALQFGQPVPLDPRLRLVPGLQHRPTVHHAQETAQQHLNNSTRTGQYSALAGDGDDLELRLNKTVVSFHTFHPRRLRLKSVNA